MQDLIIAPQDERRDELSLSGKRSCWSYLYLDKHSGLVGVVPQIEPVPLLIRVDVQGGHLTNHLKTGSPLSYLPPGWTRAPAGTR